MGNQSSRATTPTSSPQSPASVAASHGPAVERERTPHHHAARRRESIQALSTAKAQAAPPSATLDHAEIHPTLIRPHSRGPAPSHHLRAPADPAMGNEQSSPRAQRERDLKAATPRDSPPPRPAAPTPHTRPLDVPAALRDDARPAQRLLSPADPAALDYLPASSFSRPPRLPLPIEEEVHTPGSPIISPQDLGSPVEHGDADGALPKRSSMLSTTTADDDDLGDEFKPTTTGPTVSTLIEWEGPGERVYVTGTFAGWNKKYRLHPNGPSKKKNVLSTFVHIRPGTHHLTFLVDDNMTTSDKLPTAVDYTNILVNYLEVSYEDVQPAVPSATDAKPKPDTAASAPGREAPAGAHLSEVIPATPAIHPLKAPLPEPAKPVIPEPTKRYHQNIPRYLLDLDAPEESSRFARANAMTSNLPTPPTLPGFLGKSILNGTTPMKDDSSVLIHPNHTVLNHLATSSIKDNILATSATTRYKQKFLTTIMYKPKEEHLEHVY